MLTVIMQLPNHPLLAAVLLGSLALIVGSFLNVVIYRLPRMLYQEWQQQCRQLLNQPVNPEPQPLNLSWPASHCPHCGKKLRPWHNIPLLSYVLLKGRCYDCRQKISWRYPLVELLSCGMALMVFQRFGFSWLAVTTVILSWGLITLIFIDLEHQLLPDQITLSLLWLGLVLSLHQPFTTNPRDAIIGAAAGYTSLWLVGWLFQKIRRTEGIGHGDFKLLALWGAWLGWQWLPLIALSASFVGALVGLALLLLRKIDRQTPLPFGPYLAVAGWVVLLYGPSLKYGYWLLG